MSYKIGDLVEMNPYSVWGRAIYEQYGRCAYRVFSTADVERNVITIELRPGTYERFHTDWLRFARTPIERAIEQLNESSL